MALGFVTLAGRLGPALGRLGAPTLKLLKEKLSKSGAPAAATSSVKSIVDWVKNNRANSLLLISTLASIGVNVRSLWGKDQPDPDAEELIRSLEGAAGVAAAGGLSAASRLMAHNRISEVAASSELLGGVFSSEESHDDVAVVRSILAWAKGHYGSVEGAMRSHAMHQAFFELSEKTVAAGYRNLRV